MKLAKRNRKLFDDWIRNFFKEERRATSKEIWEKLQQDQPRLGKAIKRAGARVGASAYIGRYLLRPITKEGWLHVLNWEWMVQATPERCYHCFSAIDDIYVIDAEENRYCSLDCLEECPEARDPYDSYWDDYVFLYMDFADFHGEAKDLRHCLPSPENHLGVCRLLKKMDQWFEFPDYDDIWFNGGDDGPIAREMYRMLRLLNQDDEQLKSLEREMREARGKQKMIYSIEVLNLEGQLKENRAFHCFFRKNIKYFDEIRHMFSTEDVWLWHDWGKELEEILPGAYRSINEFRCPSCGRIGEDNRFERLEDNYKYCEECYEMLDI
ncbi:hypothetical protein EDD68_11072 [Melghiribacillus thermohalophilus]|uniref:Uncharacterized protein n=1 Tax=Melghiribacillus thermohalophilus TaxID=1324956 RepID=A0A4R3MYM0_9BACI|nr:hypothetical protein [Melghiribacillus thermohalophilus]TCT21768.1 hypothetical protein EDD68_11072 [Melghiribacillus thermohalophilus]